MKGNSNLKQGTVFLIAFVLVVGLVGLGGLAYGDSDSDSSDITVNVADIEIEITALEQSEQEIDILDGDEVNTADFDNDDPEDIYIEVTVTLDEDADQDNIDYLEADFYYDNDNENEHGDAVTGESDTGQEIEYLLSGDPEEDNGDEFGEWTLVENFGDDTDNADQAIYEAELEIHNMMRYGDWIVSATVEDDSDNDATDTFEFFVSTFVEIETSGDIVGYGAPGQTIGMDRTEEDIEREWTETDEIVIFRINSMYYLDSEMTELVGDETENTIGEDQYSNHGYYMDDGTSEDYGTGTPIDSELDEEYDSIEPQNQVEIPTGTEPDTYTGEVYHTLSNSEVDPSVEFVSTEDEMNDALEDDSIDTVVVTDDITTENAFYVEYEQTIKAINEHAVTITFNEDNTNALFYVQAEGVTIEDLILERNADVDEGQVAQAIRVEESDTTIHNNEFSGNAPIGVTVQDEDEDSESDTTNIRITDNTFDGFDTSVALMPALGSPGDGEGHISNVTITGNEFSNYLESGVYVDEFGHGSEIENVILTSNNFDSGEQGDGQWHVAEAYYNGEADILDWDEDGTGIIDDNTFEQDVEFEDITDDDDPDYYIIRSTEVN